MGTEVKIDLGQICRAPLSRAPRATAPEAEVPTPGRLRRAVDWLDRNTKAAPDTHGNFSTPPYIPALLIACIEGYALRGVPGILPEAAAAVSSVFVEHKTKSNLLAVATGVSVGAGLACVTFPANGPAQMVTNALTGALLGGFQSYRGNKIADTRGAGTMGALISATFMIGGAAKVSAGIAAAASKHFTDKKSPWIQAALGAGLGAAIASGLAAVGYGPSSIPYFVGASALAGGLGPILGPRYSQMFRNISKFCGTRIEAGLQKTGALKKQLSSKARNCLGALPAGATKEGFAGLLYADGHIAGLIAGTMVEAIHLAAVLWLMDNKQCEKQPAPIKPQPTEQNM